MESRNKLFYGWVIVGIAFLIMSVTYAVWYSFPFFYVSILEEFRWSRAGAALIYSIGSVVYGFGSFVGGAVLDRFGPKKSFAFSTVLLAVGLIGCSRATEIWHFFLFWGGLTSLGIAMVGFVPCVALVSGWFDRKRATAIGIAQAGGRESFIVQPIIQTLILSFGWRNTYLWLTAAVVVLIALPAQFLKRSPKEMGLSTDGEKTTPANKKTNIRQTKRVVVDKQWADTDWTLQRGLKEYRCWALLVMLLLSSAAFGIIMIHQVVFVVDIGFSKMFASYLVLIFGISSMLGRLCGFLSDMVGRERAYTLGGVGVIFGLVMLIFVQDVSHAWMLYVYSVCFGFFSGLNTPTYASTAADMFEGRHFGAILGFINIGFGLGNALGAWFGGYIFDMFQSYTIAFFAAIIVMGLACGFIWIAAPGKVRRMQVSDTVSA
ncbi:MFS transporter [Thermodesulfobacteriota bacterium]